MGAGTIWNFFPPAVGIVVAGFPNAYNLSGFDEFGNFVANFNHNWLVRDELGKHTNRQLG